MSKSLFVTLSAAVSIALAATNATAAVSVVNVVRSQLMGATFTPSAVVTFDDIPVGHEAVFTSHGISFSDRSDKGGAYIEQQDPSEAIRTLNGDESKYLALGAATTSAKNAEVVTLGKAVDRAGFYWGSINPDNLVKFKLGGVVVGKVWGTDLSAYSGATTTGAAANGLGALPTANAGAYVQFGGGEFDQIVFKTMQPTFDIDNLAIGGVPEPSTWLMIVIGVLGLGTLSYRRAALKVAPRNAWPPIEGRF